MMRFITEMELKTQYRSAPFSVFKLPSETRLTPEARQFLVDRKIKVESKKIGQQENSKIQVTEINVSDEMFLVVFQKVVSAFLLSFSFLLEKDVQLAQQVMGWLKHLEAVQQAYRQKKSIPTFQFNEEDSELECRLIQKITAFHIQLPYGRELAILNYLKASLAEFVLIVNERETATSEKETFKKVMLEVEQIEKALLLVMTQMIRSERA